MTADCDNNSTIWWLGSITRNIRKLLSHSKEQSHSLQTKRFSASQEIPRIFRSPKDHYRSHKCSLPVPIRGQILPHPTSLRSIIILSSHLRLSLPSGLFPSGFPTETLYTPVLFPICATRPAHLYKLQISVWERWGVYQIMQQVTTWLWCLHYATGHTQTSIQRH